jgi:hypothetical protein
MTLSDLLNSQKITNEREIGNASASEGDSYIESDSNPLKSLPISDDFHSELEERDALGLDLLEIAQAVARLVSAIDEVRYTS